DDDKVEVDPKVRVQQSRTPASRSTCFGISPATRPRPRGPGNTSTRTLPVLTVTLNGTVCIVPQRHSQLPQTRRIGIRFNFALPVPLSIAIRTCRAFPYPIQI